MTASYSAVPMPWYPKPDRSNYGPRRVRTPESAALDLGWSEGFLPDGRPFRAEVWAEDGITALTVFCSTHGLETLTNVEAADLLAAAGIVEYLPGGRRSAAAMPLRDAAGQSMWSINVVLGDDEGLLVRCPLPMLPYAPPAA